jgi:hypothetical protein
VRPAPSYLSRMKALEIGCIGKLPSVGEQL